jgi:uncharacterized protein (TIGR03435 family)
MLRGWPVVIGAIATLAARTGAAQQESGFQFDVASIKPSKADPYSSSFSISRGRLRITNTTVKSLIQSAYSVLPDQINGAPAWADSVHYDIEATSDDDPTISSAESSRRTNLRLKALLASRFQLAIHRETKEWQAYTLVVGKEGPKLTPTALEGHGNSMRTGSGHVEATGLTMNDLAANISNWLRRPVANQTGIEGRFDLTLDFESEGAVEAGAADTGRPSLFTAVQDQLGLKLEPKKVPVEMLIVDRIERPSEN